jgi:iron complex transport system ATP-binding protein
MDEPVAGLDYGNQWRLLALVRELAHEERAVVMSTHYPDHALHAADRVVLLHDGRVAADGAPRSVVTPANLLRV